MRFMAYKLYMVDVEMLLFFFHVNKKNCENSDVVLFTIYVINQIET